MISTSPPQPKTLTLDEIEGFEKQVKQASPHTSFKFKTFAKNNFILLIEEKKTAGHDDKKEEGEIGNWEESPKMKSSFLFNEHRDVIMLENFSEDSINGSYLDHYVQEQQEILELKQTHDNPNEGKVAPKESNPKNFIKNLMNCYTRFIYIFATQEVILTMKECDKDQKNKGRRLKEQSIEVFKSSKHHFPKRAESSDNQVNMFYKKISLYQGNKVKMIYNKKSIQEFCKNSIGKHTLKYWLRYLADYCIEQFSSITQPYKYSHRLAAKTLLQYIEAGNFIDITFRAKKYKHKQVLQQREIDLEPIVKPHEIKQLFERKEKYSKVGQIHQNPMSSKESIYNNLVDQLLSISLIYQ